MNKPKIEFISEWPRKDGYVFFMLPNLFFLHLERKKDITTRILLLVRRDNLYEINAKKCI